MLLGAINTWAQEVSLSSDMFHVWRYADRNGVPAANDNPYIVNNIGIVLNKDGVIYGNPSMPSLQYADLTDYGRMRIKGDPDKAVKVQLVFNRKTDYGQDWVNETYQIAANGILEIALPVLLSNYTYYHLNCIKFTNEQVNNGAKIQEVKLYKYEKVNLTQNMFHNWNGVGPNASYVTNDAGNAVNAGDWNMRPGRGGVIAGTGDVKKDVYADLMGYSAIYLEGTKNAYIRLVFNRWSDNDNDLVAIETRFDSNGKLLIDLKNHPDLKNQKFWHLNVIKSSWYNSSTGTITVSKIELWKSLEVGFPEKNDDINTQYSLSYEIANNSQREFTFVNHSANSSDNNYGWALWATNRERTNDKRKDYFFMNMVPSMQIYDENSGGLAEPAESSLYIKNGNDLETMSDAQMQQFRNDMANGCYVSVKVANYDGIITVYSVMKKDGRVYVYATKYDKYDSSNGAINVFFTVDHALLTNFRAKNAVSTRKVFVGGINYPENTEDRFKTCSVVITTLDGYVLPSGTAVGQGDTVTYHAIPGRKWEFEKWGNSNVTDNPRNIVLARDDINPFANFKRPFFDPATDRVFFEDFENLDEPRVAKREIRDDDGNLIRTDVATNSGIETVTEESDITAYEATPERDNYHYQGKYLNYGGKGRVLKDPVFGKYYQNLADGTNEYTKSVAENFLRIILTDEQRENIGGHICRYNGKYETPKPDEEREATIGFWVNAKIANKYELPLERGSMFCVFSNERFRKADAGNIETGQEPRFMFDLACNGTTYSNMPKSIAGENGGPLIDYDNFFFYGDTVPLTNTPTPSLFGEKFYKNAQDQTTSKFYDDDQWHYVAYVATNGLKTVTLFVDGEECGKMDMTTLGEGLKDFNVEGDFSGRTFYLRNIVLGGFTPHGLFFQKEYYEDAAIAFDDIAIYSSGLIADEIKVIIDAKHQKSDEWHFTTALKAYGASGEALDAATWESKGNGVYRLIKKSNTESAKALGLPSTKGLTFRSGDGDIYVDLKNGRIGLTRDAGIYIPNVGNKENLYFIAKPDDQVKYPLDHYDLYPYDGAVGDFYTRGVSFYGGEGKEDFSMLVAYKHSNLDPCGFRLYRHTNYDINGNNHNVNTNKNILWLSDIMISPYCMVYTNQAGNIFGVQDRKSVLYVDVVSDGVNVSVPTLPILIFTKGDTRLDNMDLADYKQGNTKGNPYIRYSSSAPHVATVDQNGNVKIKGIAGYATIKAELVFDNIHDGCISTAYTIRVTEEKKTFVAKNESGASTSVYGVGEQFTVKSNDGKTDEVTLTMGGWAYTDSYGDNGEKKDSWSNGFGFLNSGDIESIDGITTASEGNQNATSESYLKKDENGNIISYGEYSPAIISEANNTPWTLPSRGAYLKFEPNKAGVLSVYVLQNGNLYKSNSNQNYSDQIKWRPVYVTDETGAVVKDVIVVTNSKISENDNFFKEGRRRAQFIEDIEGTYNQRLKNALLQLKSENNDRFHLLIDNWENAGWKQKVIETGDGGYMLMSKGIVRYIFNVYPGKTYYIFSNHTKIAYSGYHFEEGQLINKNSFETAPIRSATTGSEVVFEDRLNMNYTFPIGEDLTPVTYKRPFTLNTWSSICLPFSMNSKQVKEVFGDSTAVVIVKTIHDNGKLELIWHTNQDIIAGYPYLILPKSNDRNRNESRETINRFSKVNVHFEHENPLFVVSSDSQTYEPNGSYNYKTNYPYVFEGNFKDEELPAGSYVMSNNGVLTQIKKSVTAKPFRAYLRKDRNYANAKPLTIMGFSDSEGETTSVEEILQDNGIILESSDVYGVNGVKVRSNTHSLEGLSKGVYVVNGKKYVVK